MVKMPRLTAVLLAFALGLGACDRAPELPTAPAFSAQHDLADGSDDAEESEYTLVEGDLTADLTELVTSLWIGPEGGTLSLGGVTLEVPEGAVSTLTLFTIELPTAGLLETELTAQVEGLLGLVNVGSQGFAEPVKLTISYENAASRVDVDDVLIVNIEENGTLVPYSSNVDDDAETVSALLPHFSRWCVATN